MSIRITVRTDDANMAAHVGGSVLVEHKSFVIEANDLEAFLRERLGNTAHRQIVGYELLGGSHE